MKPPIITSLMDLDFYKLTMQQAAYYYENSANVRYEFTCRATDIDFSDSLDEIWRQIYGGVH